MNNRKTFLFLFFVLFPFFSFWPPQGGVISPVFAGEIASSSPLPSSSISSPPAATAKSSWSDTLKGLMDPKAARATFNRLSDMGKAALPDLKQMLRGRNLRLVRAALDLADRLGDSADGAGQDLAVILQNPHLGNLRLRALSIMGRFGETANQYVPVMLAALKDSNDSFRLALAESVIEIWSKRVKNLPELAKALKDPKSPFRRLLVEGLQKYGHLAHPLLPLVATYLKTGKVEPREVAKIILPKMVPGLSSLTGWAAEALMPGEEEIGPDSIAFEPDESDLAQAEAAESFEDIPASE